MKIALTNGNFAEGVVVVDTTGTPSSGGSGGSGGDASAANQVTQTTKLTSIDGKLPTLVSGRLPVDVQSLSVTVSNASLEISNDVGNPVPINGTVSISNINSDPSTGTNQVNQTTKLTSIDGKLPSVLVSDRLKVDGSGVTQPVSGTVAFSNSSIGISSLPSLPAGSNAIGSVSVSNFPSTQPISASSLPLPTNAASQSDIQAVRDRLMPSGTTYSNVGAAVSSNLKNSAGNVYSISCSNQTSSLVWFQLFDKSTAPANGDTPIRSYPLYASSNSNPGFLLIGQDIIGGSGISFSTGIGWAISSTATTLTLSTASTTNFISAVRYV